MTYIPYFVEVQIAHFCDILIKTIIEGVITLLEHFIK